MWLIVRKRTKGAQTGLDNLFTLPIGRTPFKMQSADGVEPSARQNSMLSGTILRFYGNRFI